MAVQRRKDRNGRVLPDGVTHRADGRYLYRTQLYGKPHYIYDRDLDELKKKILEFQVDVSKGRVEGIGKLTLNEWYPQYLQIYKVGKIKPASLANLRKYYKWYIQGSIIDRAPMNEVKRSMVVAYLNELGEKKKLSKTTLKSLASMMHGAFQQLIYDGGLSLNPFNDVMKDVKAKPKEYRDALSEEEVKVLVDFLKEEGFQHIYMPLICIGLSTGFRYSELVGLTWEDVDFDNRVISINHQINYRDRSGEGKHEFFASTPKTENGIREFPMTEELVYLFKQQKQYQKDMRIRQDVCIDGYKGFIFTSTKGYPYTHEAVIRVLKLITKRCNEWEEKRAREEGRKPVVVPKHTFHFYRHTFITTLVKKKVGYEILKMLAGHASIRTSIDVYTHIEKELVRSTRTDLEDIIKIL